MLAPPLDELLFQSGFHPALRSLDELVDIT